MPSLDALLKNAATPTGWASIVRRCAWCSRVADADGSFQTGLAPAGAAVTHVTCPPCAARALRDISRRGRCAA